MKAVAVFLIVDSHGDVRLRKTAALAWNEVGYRIVIHVPESWGRVLGTFNVTMPEAPLPDVDLPEGWEWATA